MTKLTALFLALLMAVTMTVPALAADTAHKTDEVTELETRNSELSKLIALDGVVLLENNGALPIAAGGKIALFGQGAYKTIKGGTGSGDVNQRAVVTVREAFETAGFEVTTAAYMDEALVDYEAKLAEWNAQEHASRWESYKHQDLAISPEQLEAAKAADTAIYIISRNSGEGDDRTIGVGDYWLSDNEVESLKLLSANFDKVIVCLNVGGMMDTSFFNGVGTAQAKIEGLDALVLMSQGGQQIGNVLLEILTGKVTPSGKLTDTWAANYEDYPAGPTIGNADGDGINEYYNEGIYVGYRWFDTFNKPVAYPFGYGLSYTTFDIQLGKVTADMDYVTVVVNVTNTGDTYSGKEVVEIYASAPWDEYLDVPYQELMAFAKTKTLAPGESQTLKISFRTTELSSYSEFAEAYVMNAGEYIIRAGNSSRNTHVAAVLTLEEPIITEQLSSQFEASSFEADKTLDPVINDGKQNYTYAGEAEEIAAAGRIALDPTGFVTPNNASAYEDELVVSYVFEGSDYTPSGNWNETVVVVPAIPADVPATLKSVYDGKITMAQFLASLSVEEMAYIVNGNRMTAVAEPVIGAQANSVNGAAGESTSLYYETRQIPNIVMADGPAGIRITQSYQDEKDGNTYYQFCTAWPIGAMLAQTWDTSLLETFGTGVGAEMIEYGVTLWLAPGMNIHRDPLCGRNFEYYSEDPLLTGMMAAAATKGVQSHPGIGVTIKHYAGNNQEINRNTQNNTVSERALREIYLKGFEIAVKSAQPMAIMSSYNYNNSIYASEDHSLLNDMTRGEWGFKGMIMTDWGAGGRSTVQGQMHAGNDLIMPGGQQERIIKTFDKDAAFEPLANGSVDGPIALGDLQACAGRVLNLLMQSSQFAKMHEDVFAVPYTDPATVNYIVVK